MCLGKVPAAAAGGAPHTSQAESRRISKVRAVARLTEGTKSEASGLGVASPPASLSTSAVLDSWVPDIVCPEGSRWPICKLDAGHCRGKSCLGVEA